MVFLKHRTADPAIYVYETALKSRPDVPKLWFGLGLSHYLRFPAEQAEQALRKALALDPQYDAAYVVLGDLLEQSSRTADALDVFRKAMEMRPDLYLSYYYYGKLASKGGDENSADAIAKLRKAVSLNPNFPQARYELGKALIQAGQDNRSHPAAEQESGARSGPGTVSLSARPHLQETRRSGSASRSSFGCLKRQTRRQNRKISFSVWKFRLKSLDKSSSRRRLACVLGFVLGVSWTNTAAPQQRPDKPNPAAKSSLSKQISAAEAAAAQRPQDPQVLMRLVKLYQAEGEFGKSLPLLERFVVLCAG